MIDGEKVPRVSDEQNKELLEPVTGEEVKNTVFGMHPHKSPGHDGFNPAFFLTYWSIVGKDVIEFCRHFFDTGELPTCINYRVVFLIPKVIKPQQMQDLRPISPCNVLMRVLSKVMANRLKQCLNTIISDKQSAFVEGRLLTDSALIAYKMNHYIRRKTQGKNGCVGLKIDVSQAYDRLEWNFIENMMVRFGFNQRWIDRIMGCVKMVSYGFLKMGKFLAMFFLKGGFDKGILFLLIYIYIMCAEGLGAIIRRNESVGLINGCSIARGAPSISHLFFADDCYLFFRANEVEAGTIKNVLQRYEMISGQAINYNKSNITFSPNTMVDERARVCARLGVQEINEPGKYLGMPMCIGRNKMEVFGALIDRVGSKVQGWSNKVLSKGGKLTLIKSGAQFMPNFWMSIFMIPAGVCEKIERQLNGFLVG